MAPKIIIRWERILKDKLFQKQNSFSSLQKHSRPDRKYLEIFLGLFVLRLTWPERAYSALSLRFTTSLVRLLVCLLAVIQQILGGMRLSRGSHQAVLPSLPEYQTTRSCPSFFSSQGSENPDIHTCANNTFQYLKLISFFHGVGAKIKSQKNGHIVKKSFCWE